MTLAAANGAVDMIGLLRGVYLARVLPIEVLAGWNLLASTAALGGSLGSMGEWNYLATKDRSQIRSISGAVFGFALAKALGVCLITAGLAVFAWATSSLSVPIWAFICVALVPLIRGFGNPGIGLAAREGRVWIAFWPGFFSQLGALIFAVAAIGISAGIGRVVLLLVMIPVVHVIVGYVCEHDRCRPRWDPVLNRKLCSFGLPLLAEAILFSGSRWLELVLVGRVVGAEGLAGWAAILVLIRNPVAIAQRTWMARVLPMLADSYTNKDPSPSAIGRLVFGAIGAATLIGIGVLVFAAVSLPVVYAGRFDSFAACLLPAAAAASSLCFRAFLTPHVLALGATMLLARTTFLASLGVPAFGIALGFGCPVADAAWGLLFGEVLAVLGLLSVTLRGRGEVRLLCFGGFLVAQIVQLVVGFVLVHWFVSLGSRLAAL